MRHRFFGLALGIDRRWVGPGTKRSINGRSRRPALLFGRDRQRRSLTEKALALRRWCLRRFEAEAAKGEVAEVLGDEFVGIFGGSGQGDELPFGVFQGGVADEGKHH